MTTFAEAVAKVSSQKHLLFEVEPAEELWSWTKTGGYTNVYEIAWAHHAATDVITGGLYRLLISIEEDGTALTERASIALVDANAGSWYHDSSAEKIYAHTTGSVDPDTLDMMAAIFRLHFSTSGRIYNVTPAGYEARDLDGSNDYYETNSGLEGSENGKKGIFSCLLRRDATGEQWIIDGDHFYIEMRADHKIRIVCADSGGTALLLQDSTTTYGVSTDYIHILLVWDVANAIAEMWVNDVSVGDTPMTLASGDIYYNDSRWGVGAPPAYAAYKLNGALSEVYLTLDYPGTFDVSMRRRFIDADGKPVYLGADGSLPTGSQPIIYTPDGDASNNLGYGGNFTANGNPVEAVGPTPRHYVYFEKRILVDSSANVIEKTADLVIGRQRTSRGEISLDNTDGLFDKLSRAWNWKNKAARYRFGLDDIALSEYETTGRLVVDDIAPLGERFTLSLVAEIDAWRQEFPLNTYASSDALGEGVAGTRIPVLLGPKTDIIPDLIDDEDAASGEWKYRIADSNYQELYQVSAVRAIKKSTGAVTTLTETTHYTVDLSGCTITVNDDWTVGGTEDVAEAYEIRCDAIGQPAAGADTSSDYIKLPGEVARWILKTFLGYTDAKLDLPSFSSVDTEVPFVLAKYFKSETTVREALRGIERSALGTIRPKKDGTVEFFVWDPWSGSASAIELSDEDFSRFETDVKMDTVYYETNVRYDENPAKPGSFQVETASHNATKYLTDSSNSIIVETYLKNAADAQTLAQRINLLYRGITIEIDFVELGVRMIAHELYERVKVTKTRAPSTAGCFLSRLMEILELKIDFVTPQVSGRLGDLRGLVNKVGMWTEDDAPAWSVATDEEKAASGFWCDDNGRADPSDLGSANVSVWW